MEGGSSAAPLDNLFIGIAGIIGAGKTTLATELGKAIGLPVYYEPVADNEYLADFYNDMPRYSFPLQVYLLNRRFQQHQQIIWQGRGGVQDRTIYEDAVFARMLKDDGLMEERDYRTYCSLFENMSNFMRRPNVVVHLDVSPEDSLERLRARGRACESGVTLDYLQKLHAAYDVFLQDIARTVPVIRADWSVYCDAEAMAAAIADTYRGMCTIHDMDMKKCRK